MSKLNAPTPASAVKTRKGGFNKELRYLSGDYVIRKLIEATGGNYSTELMSKDFITIKGKKKGEDVDLPAMLVVVRLSIPGLGSKEGFGIQILDGGGEDLYKGAFTDALKKAATQFGVGLDLYDEDFEPVEESAPVVELTPKQRVVAKLKAANNGKMSKSQADKAATDKFGVAFDEISDVQFTNWAEDLERNQPAPF
jgi:hypothetical protein